MFLEVQVWSWPNLVWYSEQRYLESTCMCCRITMYIDVSEYSWNKKKEMWIMMSYACLYGIRRIVLKVHCYKILKEYRDFYMCIFIMDCWVLLFLCERVCVVNDRILHIIECEWQWCSLWWYFFSGYWSQSECLSNVHPCFLYTLFLFCSAFLTHVYH